MFAYKTEYHFTINDFMLNLQSNGSYENLYNDYIQDKQILVIDYNNSPCLEIIPYERGILFKNYQNKQNIRKFDVQLTNNNYLSIEKRIHNMASKISDGYQYCIYCEKYYKRGVQTNIGFVCDKCHKIHGG